MHWCNAMAFPAHRLLFAAGLTLGAGQGLGDMAFVTCQTGDAVNVIDTDRGAVVAEWSAPGKPAGVAVREGEVFTVSAESKTVRRLAAKTGEVLALTELDGGPIGAVMDAQRGRLFVSDWFNARLWVLDADTLETLKELPTGAAPAGIALSPDGRLLASAEKEANQVSIFDAATLTLSRTIKVGEAPFGLGFAPGGLLFVGNVGSNDVSILDAHTGETVATVPVGERPYGVAFSADKAFVTNQYDNSVSIIDLATLTHVERIEVGEYPEGIDVTQDGGTVVLANWFDDSVTVFDAKSHAILYEISTCEGPRAFGEFLLGGKLK